MLVVIDYGHGGIDSGGVGAGGTHESDITIRIGKKVINYLNKAGIQTLETRKGNEFVTLNDRCKIINNSGAGLCVSIHNNSSVEKAAAYNAVYVQSLGHKSEELANFINERLKIKIPWPNAGIKVDNFQINRNTNCPSCLVECGFISNVWEEQMLKLDYIDDLFAQAIAVGITDYIANH